jgi:hypothetical protein
VVPVQGGAGRQRPLDGAGIAARAARLREDGRVIFIERLPKRTPGYADHQSKDAEVKRLVAEILKAGGPRVIQASSDTRIEQEYGFIGQIRLLRRSARSRLGIR